MSDLQELNQPPCVRWGFLVAFVSVGALVALTLTVVTLFGMVNSAFGDPELPRAIREEIVHANCRELSSLQAQFEFNADSVVEDVVGLRLTRKQQAQLHCANTD